MRFRVNRKTGDFFNQLTGQWIKNTEIFNFIIKQLNAYGFTLGICRVNINHLSPYPVSTTAQLNIISQIL